MRPVGAEVAAEGWSVRPEPIRSKDGPHLCTQRESHIVERPARQTPGRAELALWAVETQKRSAEYQRAPMYFDACLEWHERLTLHSPYLAE
jgi:hypothetical protein